MRFNLSRDPAFYLTLFATIVRLAVAFGTDITADQQAVLNATAAAVAGVIVALWVRRDGQVAALTGLVHALLALAVGFGLDWSAERQAVVMSAAGLLLAGFVRTQVVARVPAEQA